jgi:putative transposase
MREAQVLAVRRPSPRLAIIDIQTLNCFSVCGSRGFDAAKRIAGRKRAAMVDADGNWLAVSVAPASL